MRNIDFGTWQSVLSTLAGLTLVTLIGIGLRLLAMYTIQQKRERENRQINERLRVLIGAYKTLGGSFTGTLSVDPTHYRDMRQRANAADQLLDSGRMGGGSDRARRVRDAVEGALSDVILLGTETHVRLAERAARELAGGRPVDTHELVVELRNFIRQALVLEPIPADVSIPRQGPTRPAAASGRGRGDGGGREEGRGGARGGGGADGAMMGGGMVGGVAIGVASDDEHAKPE